MNDGKLSPTGSAAEPTAAAGSLDGDGAGDHDQPFSGFQPYHFSTRELARLLVLRGEARDAKSGRGRLADDAVAA